MEPAAQGLERGLARRSPEGGIRAQLEGHRRANCWARWVAGHVACEAISNLMIRIDYLAYKALCIIQCFLCNASLLCSALYAKRPCYYLVLYMQRVLIIQCFICNVSLLFSALHATCNYYSVLHMQRVLIIQCFICNVSFLISVLYAKWLGI